MENGLSTEATQTGMAMNYVNLLSDNDIAEYGEEREDGGECRFTVDDEEWNMVNLQSVGEISDSSASFVCVGNNNDFVSSIDEFLRTLSKSSDGATRWQAYGRQLVYVTLNST